MDNNNISTEISNEVERELTKGKKIIKNIRETLKSIGPGFVTGAADDDPSGIATYSVAGAQYGYQMTWMALFLLPAMISIQEMCGTIGMVTGKGLAGVIKEHYSKKLLYFMVMLLIVANIINIGADLGIIAACIQMLIGQNFYMWLIVVAIAIILLEIVVPFKTYSKYLKWLGLSLCAYIITAFMVNQDWNTIVFSTLIPHIQFNSVYIMTLIGFIGTTISPYLFFWQASDEVEEEIEENKIEDFGETPKVRITDIRRMRFDTKTGMIFSNMISFFIILTTAATLHVSGITNIETVQQAALSLKPLAGNFAYILFAVGVIGIGWQAIPVLAGSIGYAVSETFNFEEGLSKPFLKAKAFYIIIALATAVGVVINLFHINIIQALVYAAVVNGIASIPLIFLIIKMSSNKKIVGNHKTQKISRVVVWITFIFITLSVCVMLYTMFF